MMIPRKSPRAVFFDIDGTTYQHNIHDVPFSTYEALKQMKASGIKLGACTSRVKGEMIHLPENFLALIDGIISCAGAVIETEGKIISEHRISLEDARRISDYCRQNRIVLRWATAGLECHIDHWMQEDKLQIFEYLYQMRPTLQPFENEPLVHLLTFPPMEKEAEMRALLHDSNMITLSKTLEFTDRGISKASGICELAQHWGISMTDTLAVGDGKNDIDMFRASARSIAMGQACKEVQEAASFTTAPIDQDGFYLGLVHCGVISDTLNLYKPAF